MLSWGDDDVGILAVCVPSNRFSKPLQELERVFVRRWVRRLASGTSWIQGCPNIIYYIYIWYYIHIPKSSSVLRSASLPRCWQQTRKFFLKASPGLCGPQLYASAILQEVEHLKPTDGCPFCWAAPATDVLRLKPCPPVEPMGGKPGSILLWGSVKLLNESMDIRKYFEMAPQLSCWWKTIISRVFGHESSIHPHLTSWSMDLQVWNTWELWVFVQQLPLLTQKQEVTRPFLVFLLAVTWTAAGFSQIRRGTNMNREKQGIPWGDHHLREPWVVNGITDQKWRSKRAFWRTQGSGYWASFELATFLFWRHGTGQNLGQVYVDSQTCKWFGHA